MYRFRHLSQKAKNAILYTVLGILVVVAFFIALRAWENRQYRIDVTDRSPNEEIGLVVLYQNGKKYQQRKNLDTVLLIGLDKTADEISQSSESYSNNQQSDFLMLLLIDRESKQFIPLHLNRDSMAPVQILGVGGKVVDTRTEQLALSHTYGTGKDDSCRNTVKSVSDLLFGIEIDHYIAFPLDTVSVVNDLVGGVPLKVLDDFGAVDPSLVQGETIRLNGEQALHYVRARGGMEDSSNLARMERQRQYLSSLQTQTLVCLQQDENFSAKAFAQLSEYMTSDCTVNQLSDLLSDTEAYTFSETQTIPGEAVKGREFMEFYPDEQATRELVLRLFFEPCER